MRKTKKKKLDCYTKCLIISIISILFCSFCFEQITYGYDEYKYYSDGSGDTHLGDVQITDPASNYSKTWLAGSDHTVTCNTITDKDHKCGRNEGESWVYLGKVTDSVTHYWTGSSGMFKNNDNIGVSVSYICSYSSGTNTISAHANDNYSTSSNYYRGQTGGTEGPVGPGGNDTGTTNTKAVYVVEPTLEQLKWSGNHAITGVTTPEWDYSASRDEPACYTKNSSLTATNVRFEQANDLTDASSVVVKAFSRLLTSDEEDGTVSIPANITWLSGTGTWKTWDNGTYEISMSAGDLKLVNSIHKYNDNLVNRWYYQVSTATGHKKWIDCGTSSHTIYTVFGTPTCASSLLTTTNLETCVTWAEGCNKVDTTNDATNVPRKVQSGVKNWHATYKYTSTGIVADPFTYIPVNKGDCITYADLMTKALKLLGVSASSEYIGTYTLIGSPPVMNFHRFFAKGTLGNPDSIPHWLTPGGDADGDGTINSNESGYSTSPYTIDGVYVLGTDPTHNQAWRDANAPWNFHGACSCAGHWWEITFYCSPDHDTEANMKAVPGPVIKYWGPWENGSL